MPGIIFILVCVAIALYGVFQILSVDNKKKTFIDVNAEVTGYNETQRLVDNNSNANAGGISIGGFKISGQNNRYQTMYTPVVKYEVEGQEYNTTTKQESTTKKYAIGEMIPMMYNPSNPNECILQKNNSYFVLIAIGVVFAIIGFFAMGGA